jgi:phosphate transport system substrate-binding protein
MSPRALFLFLSLFIIIFISGTRAAEPVIVVGSATVTAPLVAAGTKLRAEGVDPKVSSDQQTSTSAIAAVGTGVAQMAVVTRPVTASERAEYSKVRLEVSPFAYQMLALVVSRDVWLSGVRALTSEQVRRIYEGEITNWKAVGGEERPIKFFNPDPGRGVWEMFTNWVYGDSRKAPLGENFEKVSTEEETRNLVEFHGGALSIVSTVRIDNENVFALAIKTDSGELVQPTVEAVRADKYPLGRRLDFVTAERPTGPVRQLIEFMQSPAGREILHRHDLLPTEVAP